MPGSETSIRLLTTKEIAAILKVTAHRVEIWSQKGTGPPYRKVGRFRYYPEDAFKAWFDAHPAGGEWAPEVKAS